VNACRILSLLNRMCALPCLFCSRLAGRRIVFQPYTREQLVIIMKSRVGKPLLTNLAGRALSVAVSAIPVLSALLSGPRLAHFVLALLWVHTESLPDSFQPNALELAGRKVANCSGDVRRCLELLRRYGMLALSPCPCAHECLQPASSCGAAWLPWRPVTQGLTGSECVHTCRAVEIAEDCQHKQQQQNQQQQGQEPAGSSQQQQQETGRVEVRGCCNGAYLPRHC